MIWWYYCQSGETKSGIGLRSTQIQNEKPGFVVANLYR